MPKKVRQFCDSCKQVTTQVQRVGTRWTCLCCESANQRDDAATKDIQNRNQKKDRLNITF